MNNVVGPLLLGGLLLGAVSSGIESPDLRIVLFLAAMGMLLGGVVATRYPPPKKKNDE